MRLYPHAPHPFVIELPFSFSYSLEAGEPLVLSLVLIGKGIEYLPYFIYAFHELGEHGITSARAKFSLLSVHSCDTNGQETLIWEESSSRILTEPQILRLDTSLDQSAPSAVTLDFLSPTRIKHRGLLAESLPFDLLIRRLLKRLTALCYFHCGCPPAEIPRAFIKLADTICLVRSNLKWQDWHRFSSRQRARLKLGGFIGSVTYSGDLRPFWRLLHIGKLIHIGKATAFGLGKYSIRKEKL